MTSPTPPRRLRRLVLQLLYLAAAVEVVIPLLLLAACNSLLFYPAATPLPEEVVWRADVPGRVVRVVRPDGRKLAAYDVAPRGLAEDAPVVLFLHGNAGNIAQRAGLASRFAQVADVRLLMPDYSGYGGNEGSPSEDEIDTDALAAFDHLVADGVPAGRIVVFGESIGGWAGHLRGDRAEGRGRRDPVRPLVALVDGAPRLPVDAARGARRPRPVPERRPAREARLPGADRPRQERPDRPLLRGRAPPRGGAGGRVPADRRRRPQRPLRDRRRTTTCAASASGSGGGRRGESASAIGSTAERRRECRRHVGRRRFSRRPRPAASRGRAAPTRSSGRFATAGGLPGKRSRARRARFGLPTTIAANSPVAARSPTGSGAMR